MSTTPTLTDRDKRLLSIESTYRNVGLKAQAIRDELGITPPQFYVELNALIETEAALAWDPILTRRLLARRSHRARVRAALPDAFTTS